MAIPDSFIQELSDRSPIEEIVSDYVRLTKRTGSNLFGLCPFHSEKTPSFSVRPDMQSFHCFGCNKGGGVIKFIMEIENLPFTDAIHFLARRAGMQVPEDKPDPNSQKRQRMLELNKDAAKFFYECLRSHPSRGAAQDYVKRRDISPNMVKNFGIGFAPDEWQSLTDVMRQKGYTAQELADAGLVRHSSNKSGSVYDTFRNRLMFPVIDVRGSVIGFSGRILGDGEPKYMNSPETLVFNKRRNLFALNLAKKSKNGYIILSEGNIDVVALHQAGFDSAVASLGTALTQEQARLLARYTNEIVIAYDSDEAGQKASQRAIDILSKLDMRVRVLRMTGAKDPDEFIKLKGADALKNLLERSENHIEYRLSSLGAKFDISKDDQRVSFLREAAVLLSELQNPIEREVYSGRVAQLAGVSADVIESEVKRLQKRRSGRETRKYEQDSSRPSRAVQPTEKGMRYDDPVSAVAEEGILRLVYLEPSLLKGVKLVPEDFSSELLGRFFERLTRLTEFGSMPSMDALTADFTSEEISHLSRVLNGTELDAASILTNADEKAKDYIKIIRSQKRKKSGMDFAATAEMIKKQKQGHGG